MCDWGAADSCAARGDGPSDSERGAAENGADLEGHVAKVEPAGLGTYCHIAAAHFVDLPLRFDTVTIAGKEVVVIFEDSAAVALAVSRDDDEAGVGAEARTEEGCVVGLGSEGQRARPRLAAKERDLDGEGGWGADVVEKRT